MDIKYMMGTDAVVGWDQIQGPLAKYIKHDDTWSEEQILRMVMQGDAMVWTVHDKDKIIAILIIRSRSYRESDKFIEVMIAAGERFDDWADDVMVALKRYADQECAAGLRAMCRPGMAKWLKSVGWKHMHTIMEFKP